MVVLKVEDMHCQNCVKRISNVLTEEGIKFKIDLDTKTVEVEESKVEQAVESMSDLGFEAKK